MKKMTRVALVTSGGDCQGARNGRVRIMSISEASLMTIVILTR